MSKLLGLIDKVKRRVGLAASSTSDGKPGAINYSRVIHLSHVIHQGIPLWPGDPAVEFETVAGFSREGYYLRRFSMGEHSGTHMSAPSGFHQGEGAPFIDSYDAGSLVAPAVVIDIREGASAGGDYEVTREDILEWEILHGRIPSGSLVLLHSGWQERWHDEDLFLGRDSDGALHYPGFGLDATRYLLEEREVAGMGTDTHGLDHPGDTAFQASRLLLKEPRVLLENLANLDQLPPVGATLVIGILRLQGGSGSPAAVLAFVP